MSRQFTFYATPADISAMQTIIRKRDPVAFLHSRSPGPEPKIVPSLHHGDDGQPWYFFFLARKADLETVQTYEIPGQGYWRIDDHKSPVVQVVCGALDGNVMRPGRVYCRSGYYDESGAWTEHPSEFLSWAKWLFAALKRSMTRIEGSSDYAGKDAMAWAQEGGRFEPDRIGIGKDRER